MAGKLCLNSDCFGYIDGKRCKALNERKLYASNCPFYCTEDDLAKKQASAFQRLYNMQRFDLIEKYHINNK